MKECLTFVEEHQVLVAVMLALLGYYVKYLHDLALVRRKGKLERTNHQLRLLYGPLYSLSYASKEAWEAFRSRHRPGVPFFQKKNPPTKEDLLAWRVWMQQVFMPLNRQMIKTVVENADMLEDEMPEEFLKLVAHVSGYETALARWEEGDYSEHLSVITFPKGFEKKVKTDYDQLRKRQKALLAQG